jgi:hypothetical protein
MKLTPQTLTILQFVLFIGQNAIAQGLVPSDAHWGKWITLVVSSTVLFLGLKGIHVMPPPKAPTDKQ